MPPHAPLRPAPLALAILATAALGAAPAGARSITGVCPDGSVFVVQSAASIPCRNAKRVEPGEVPPLRPEFLPRPYAWEVFQARRDPNNPYNLIDAARAQRRPEPDGPAPVGAPPPGTAPPPPRAATAPGSAPEPASAAELRLAESEIRDLLELVDLSQRVSPAAFTLRGEGGEEVAALRLAHSEAFEARLRRVLGLEGARGPVVLYAASAERPTSFHPNLTFVQGHVAFHPAAGDPAQQGFLHGGPGELAPGERVLGYAVLPEGFDASRPMDVYWDDRLLSARLR